MLFHVLIMSLPIPILILVSIPVNVKMLNSFLVQDIPKNQFRRLNDEKILKEAEDDLRVKLNHNLCRQQTFINDKKFKYVLLTNDVCKDKRCCNMTDHTELEWVKNIEWQAVFDFNPNSLKDGLAQRIMESKDVLVKPRIIPGNPIHPGIPL